MRLFLKSILLSIFIMSCGNSEKVIELRFLIPSGLPVIPRSELVSIKDDLLKSGIIHEAIIEGYDGKMLILEINKNVSPGLVFDALKETFNDNIILNLSNNIIEIRSKDSGYAFSEEINSISKLNLSDPSGRSVPLTAVSSLSLAADRQNSFITNEMNGKRYVALKIYFNSKYQGEIDKKIHWLRTRFDVKIK